MQKQQTAQQEKKIPGNRAGNEEQDPQAAAQDGSAEQSATEEDPQASATEEGPQASATEDDGSPVLDEQDLEENNLSEEAAENVEWEPEEKNSGNA